MTVLPKWQNSMSVIFTEMVLPSPDSQFAELRSKLGATAGRLHIVLVQHALAQPYHENRRELRFAGRR
jgi:hypothetical protein